jgi:acylglycerol lipase
VAAAAERDAGEGELMHQADLLALPDAAIPPGVAAVPTTRFGTFEAADGRRLAYHAIEAPNARHHLLYLHGIESHGGWFLPAALRLRGRGCTTWLLDRRGSGLNRAKEPGHAPSAKVLLDDVRRARAHLGDPPLHLVGLSWGGKLATAAAIEQPANVQSLVLLTPGLCPRVDLPLRDKLRVAFDLLFGGTGHFDVPLRPEMFTRDPALLEFLRRDPLRVTEVTSRFLLATGALDRLVARRVRELRVPTLLLLAGEDEIVDNDAVLRLLSPLPPGQLQVWQYPDAMHSIQLERTDAMVDDVLTFLETRHSSW